MTTRYPARLPVDPSDAGTPVDRFLRRKLAADPPHVRKLLRQKRVRFTPAGDGEAGGTGAPAPATLAYGDALAGSGVVDILAAPAERRPPSPNRKARPRVLFSDEDVAVIDKPAGVAMHPGPRHGSDTLLNGLVARYPELTQLGADRGWGLVHRLDLETSGLVVVARSVLAHDGLVAQFKARAIEKRYVALVHLPEKGVRLGPVKKPVGGRDALTELESAEAAGDGADVALVRCRPITGRTHQIRVHLAARRCPVLYDKRYGTGPDEKTARLYLKRLALHAAALGFAHPRSGKALRFERELPRDLRHSWRRAKKLCGAQAPEGTAADADPPAGSNDAPATEAAEEATRSAE